jgi:hypothetical protein
MHQTEVADDVGDVSVERIADPRVLITALQDAGRRNVWITAVHAHWEDVQPSGRTVPVERAGGCARDVPVRIVVSRKQRHHRRTS